MNFATRFCFPIVLAGVALAGAGPAQVAPGIKALQGVARGQWELRERGSTAATRKICIAEPVALTQIRHGSTVCSRFVIDNQPKRATVHYTCPGSGHGRTTIRVESNVLLQIESQGIVNNAPFNASYEARRVGACQ
jgi:hypothetical protein